MNYNIARQKLKNILTLTLTMVEGGVGVEGYTSEQYIADVVREWCNTPQRLRMALDCFQKNLLSLGGAGCASGSTISTISTGKHRARIGGRYGWMEERALEKSGNKHMVEKIAESKNGIR